MLNTYNIIGIDPGNNLGISCFNINSNNTINTIETNIVILSKRLEDDDPRLLRMELLESILTDLNDYYQPVAVGLESAFMNTKFATAVIQLSQYVSMIEYTFYKLNPFIKLMKYPPKYIKSKISTGDATKEDMMTGLSKIKEITNILDLECLTEHQIDATAIAYTLLQDIRSYPLYLQSK